MSDDAFYDWTSEDPASFVPESDGVSEVAEGPPPTGSGSRTRANRRSQQVKRSDMPASPGSKRTSPSSRRRGHESAPSPRPRPEPSSPTPSTARGSLPAGFRSSRRTTRAGKANRRDLAWYRAQLAAADAGKRFAIIAAGVVLGLAVAVAALILVANGINMAARWFAESNAASTAQARRHEQARENILIIGVKDGHALGFIAARADLKTRRIFGIAIPDGAYVEVPGQGLQPIGDSYVAGASTAKAAVSNYLSVPFERYLAVPYAAYQAALQNQSLAGITKDVVATDINANDLQVLGSFVDAIPTKDVAIVPLPVKPITINGKERFLQPQRQQVADLLKTWWGVNVGPDDRVRIIVQNGVGQPGVAGEAAKQLIGTGFSVVDTKNAPEFGRKKTLIVLYRGPASNAERVRQVLGVGEIRRAVSDQDLTDIIVVIGSDYVPPAAK